MMALDRFNDFVSGSSATAPVCEAGAQAICVLLICYFQKFPFISSIIFEQIKKLFKFNSEEVGIFKFVFKNNDTSEL